MAFADTLKQMQTGGSADPRFAGTVDMTSNRVGGLGSHEAAWEEPAHTTRAGKVLYAPGYGAGAGGATVKLTGGGAGFGGVTPAGGAGGTGGTGGTGFGGAGTGYAGLQSLAARDTTASRKAIEDALYAGQEGSINTAADRARAAMIEGTFARGVGSSSILTELAARGTQEHADALARARREAFTQAGAEDRADLAADLGIYGTMSNVELANLAREQQGGQFDRNLAFQGSENAANRAQNASQFGSNLDLQNRQLNQQADQFGRNLVFQGGENAANRALTTGENALNREFTAGENTANRTFTAGESAAARELQRYLQETGQTFTAGENAAGREFTSGENAAGREFTRGESAASRDLQRYLAETGQTYTANQNQLTRDQQMEMLLLQLANSRDLASGRDLAAGAGAAGAGIGNLLGPAIAELVKKWGTA